MYTTGNCGVDFFVIIAADRRSIRGSFAYSVLWEYASYSTYFDLGRIIVVEDVTLVKLVKNYLQPSSYLTLLANYRSVIIQTNIME